MISEIENFLKDRSITISFTIKVSDLKKLLDDVSFFHGGILSISQYDLETIRDFGDDIAIINSCHSDDLIAYIPADKKG